MTRSPSTAEQLAEVPEPAASSTTSSSARPATTSPRAESVRWAVPGAAALAAPGEQAAARAATPMGLMALVALRVEGSSVVLRHGRDEVLAQLDPTVHPTVIATAARRGERVVAQREGEIWVVLGALRTSPTPGVEEAEEFEIRAARVRVRASDEFTVASGTSSFAVRAYGAIETIAETITSRASAVHKIVGRMLHLN